MRSHDTAYFSKSWIDIRKIFSNKYKKRGGVEMMLGMLGMRFEVCISISSFHLRARLRFACGHYCTRLAEPFCCLSVCQSRAYYGVELSPNDGRAGLTVALMTPATSLAFSFKSALYLLVCLSGLLTATQMLKDGVAVDINDGLSQRDIAPFQIFANPDAHRIPHLQIRPAPPP